MLTPAEKLLNIAVALTVLSAYGWIALGFVHADAARGLLGRLRLDRARVRALLARTEPAVLLDSARAVALLAWLRYMPDPEALAGTLARSADLALPVGVFRYVDVAAVPGSAIHVAVWIYRVALVLAALGLLVRASALLAALANVFAWSVAFCFDHAAHFHAVPLILIALALCPVRSPTIFEYARAILDRRPLMSVGSYPAWVRFAVIFAVSTAYFQAGVEKLIRSGPLWVNGTTLAGHLLRTGTELGQRLVEAPHLVLVMASIGILAWELSFGLVLFFPRLRPLGVVSAVFFHAVLLTTMALGFRHLVASLVFLVTPWELATFAIWRSAAVSPARGAPVISRRRAVVLAALLALQWVPTFVRGGVYPFLGYDMFNGYYRGGEVLVQKAHLGVRVADGHWIEIDPVRALFLSSAHFTEQAFYRYVSDHPRHAKNASTRAAYCETLLAHVRAHESPDWAELRIEADTVRAGTPNERKRVQLVHCRRFPRSPYGR